MKKNCWDNGKLFCKSLKDLREKKEVPQEQLYEDRQNNFANYLGATNKLGKHMNKGET